MLKEEISLLYVHTHLQQIPSLKKDQFCEELSDRLSGLSGAYYIRGDMNARFYNREEEDEQTVGTYCLWREAGYINTVDTH